MIWRRFSGEPLRIPVKKAVEDAIVRETEAGYKLKVCIGTDSQVRNIETEFATVIVFLREKHGGFMFISNEKTTKPYTIKERMLVEVAKSIEIAYELCDLFNKYDVDMEVHADINTLKAMRPCARQWAISWVWAMPSRLNPTLLLAVAAPTKWSIDHFSSFFLSLQGYFYP
jgi:predicted RNase H-related nuclease YkuK (DUF458 family)